MVTGARPRASAVPAVPALPALRAASRWHYLLQFTAVAALLGSFQFVMSPSEVIGRGFGVKLFLLARMAGLVLLCTWLLRRGGERWVDVGLRRPRRWWKVPLLLAAGFVLLIVVSSAMQQVILPAIGAQPPNLGAQRAIRGDLAEYLYGAIPVAWGSAAFGEELVVRGFLLDRLVKALGSSRTSALLLAIGLQAALFGAFHLYQGVGGALLTGTVGLLIGLLWLWGGRNLWACILLHGLVDFIAATEAFTAGPGA
jgi:membrane protease YdiL (CAAX protease family)